MDESAGVSAGSSCFKTNTKIACGWFSLIMFLKGVLMVLCQRVIFSVMLPVLFWLRKNVGMLVFFKHILSLHKKKICIADEDLCDFSRVA